MSLLLEALKKAEKAKEEAQRRAEGGEPDPEATIAPSRPVMTKDQLPEIPQQALEIVTDELQLAPDPAPKPAPEPAADTAAEPGPSPSPRPARPQSAARAAAPAQSAERSAARKVFEVKFKEPNPRMPFYITMGGLGVFALGTIVYFYIQLRPPPSLVNLNPAPAGAQEATAAAGSAPMRSPVQTAAAGPAAIPGLPGAAQVAPAASAPAAPAAGAAPSAASTPAPTALPVPREAGPAVPAVRSPEPRRIKPVAAAAPADFAPGTAPAAGAPARPGAQVHPRVDAGYAAYQSGDFAGARREYEQALADESGNRDALLGIAALDVRAGRFEAAEATYLRLLATDPKDASAHAALAALRSGRQDPLAAESRLKTLLAADPRSHVLNFALGNQFAQQKRWQEAQQEYFKAASAEPDNPDFAYNLAVSLDQLRQSRLALEYYQRAIALAQKRGAASFDLAAARSRVAQLAKAPTQ